MFGTPVDTPIRGLNYLFPRPEVLASADLSKAGISDASAGLLRKLAASMIFQHLGFARVWNLEQCVSQLGAICGIDQSTANYIAMRAFGAPDAFPSDELWLRRRLAGSSLVLRSAQVLTMAERWRPWRAYAAMHVAQ
jgi:AraC family transcriptional regulator of adaptative response / DNA-3-methyladenine glycosylase II